MTKRRVYDAGNYESGLPYFKIDGITVTKEKWLKSIRASVNIISRNRDEKGRFKKRIESAPPIPTVKIVTYRERIRGTRIARVMVKAYPKEMTQEQIEIDLNSQYDRGMNYVIGIKSTTLGFMSLFEEKEIERGLPGSGDES